MSKPFWRELKLNYRLMRGFYREAVLPVFKLFEAQGVLMRSD